jgi:hypothetical protein
VLAVAEGGVTRPRGAKCLGQIAHSPHRHPAFCDKTEPLRVESVCYAPTACSHGCALTIVDSSRHYLPVASLQHRPIPCRNLTKRMRFV